MKLYNEVKSTHLKFRKNKNKVLATAFGTVLGEAELKAEMVDGEKFISDETMIKVLKLNLKSEDEKLKLSKSVDNNENILKIIVQLEQFVPKQMTVDDFQEVIEDNDLQSENIGVIMRFFKENYAGGYDAKLLATYVKGL